MNKPKLVRPRRFQILRKGELTYEEHRFICLIHEVSEKGLFVVCNYDLEVGLDLEVSVELKPGLPFKAKIKVKHFDNGCFGAEIMEADPDSRTNLKKFLESNYAGQSSLPERRTRS